MKKPNFKKQAKDINNELETGEIYINGVYCGSGLTTTELIGVRKRRIEEALKQAYEQGKKDKKKKMFFGFENPIIIDKIYLEELKQKIKEDLK